MEILFENSYVRNKELAKEIYRYFYFQRKFLVVCYVFLLISFFANILSAIFESACHWSVVILVPSLFAFQFVCYYAHVKNLVKRDLEVHGKEICVQTVVTDAYIRNTASTGAVNDLEYANIRYAIQTKNLILLRSKANLLYIFRKDTFTKGDAQSFLAYLNSRGIQVK